MLSVFHSAQFISSREGDETRFCPLLAPCPSRTSSDEQPRWNVWGNRTRHHRGRLRDPSRETSRMVSFMTT